MLTHSVASVGRGLCKEMLQGADDAEAAEASGLGSSVPRRIWGPVCDEHTHAIGAPAPVASVLLGPSSAAANLVLLCVCLECTSAHVGRWRAVCVSGIRVGVLAIAR